MSKLPLGSVFKIILKKKTSLRFLTGTIASFSFSIAVILSTIGLMDGYVVTLKEALAKSNGDIKFTSPESFFLDEGHLFKSSQDIEAYTTLLQLESFALINEQSKGVLLKGIDQEKFKRVTGINTEKLGETGVLLGSQLQKHFDLKVGEQITLAVASGKAKNQGSVLLRSFTIKGIVDHGIFEKDLRFIYANKSTVSNLLDYKDGTSNLGLIKLKPEVSIESALKQFAAKYGEDYGFEAFWSEFEVLLDAVEVEKVSISLILQLIVIVAILNVVAFIIFIYEIKAQDFFMLRALGLSIKSFQNFWFVLLFLIWSISCLISIGLVEIFTYAILKLPFLQIPGDIYELNELKTILDVFDYMYVFGVSLVWIFLIGFFTMRRFKKQSLISGLRQEFS